MTYATLATIGCIAIGIFYGLEGNQEAAFMFIIISNVWAAADFIKRGK